MELKCWSTSAAVRKSKRPWPGASLRIQRASVIKLGVTSCFRTITVRCGSETSRFASRHPSLHTQKVEASSLLKGFRDDEPRPLRYFYPFPSTRAGVHGLHNLHPGGSFARCDQRLIFRTANRVQELMHWSSRCCRQLGVGFLAISPGNFFALVVKVILHDDRVSFSSADEKLNWVFDIHPSRGQCAQNAIFEMDKPLACFIGIAITMGNRSHFGRDFVDTAEQPHEYIQFVRAEI